MTLTGAQVRAARTLLGWPQHRLATELGISLSEFASFEAGKSQLTVLQTSVLKRVLDRAGVEFEDDGGVRLREGKDR
jgi:transcriptional regulator with XRE-family HTH domain